MDNSVTL